MKEDRQRRLIDTGTVRAGLGNESNGKREGRGGRGKKRALNNNPLAGVDGRR